MKLAKMLEHVQIYTRYIRLMKLKTNKWDTKVSMKLCKV